MNKSQVINTLLADKITDVVTEPAHAYAPANIALAKYWGKRDEELNLPNTSSLSISLGSYGATTEITRHHLIDYYELNGVALDVNSEFCIRLRAFLDLFRPTPDFHFSIKTQSTVPIAAGVASSASGFAALTLALNQFFSWDLPLSSLSILARLGSGSACRSLWQGFVEWHAGTRADGMDSYAEPLVTTWPELQIGLILLNTDKKSISSRSAMQQTVRTSPFYKEWPQLVASTIQELHQAITDHDFSLLGKTAEKNSLAMHATMMTAQPSICYTQPETITAMQKVWQLRHAGLPIYFTQDAGPNLKLLFLRSQEQDISSNFPGIIMIDPWEDHKNF